MGRAHEVRAASMAKTAAMKSAKYAKWGKEIFQAAKAGVPDPEMNQGLKNTIARAKKDQCPADVIKRAIEKAQGVKSGATKEKVYEEHRLLHYAKHHAGRIHAHARDRRLGTLPA